LEIRIQSWWALDVFNI